MLSAIIWLRLARWLGSAIELEGALSLVAEKAPGADGVTNLRGGGEGEDMQGVKARRGYGLGNKRSMMRY